MLQFSNDPDVAEQQMNAIIFYLTAFGYVDGDFSEGEKTFVKEHIRRLIAARALDAMMEEDAAARAEVVRTFTAHFHDVFAAIDRQVRDLFTEVVADGESVAKFVAAKLKLRCYEIFKSFDDDNQRALLETVDELIHADGQVHAAEEKFRVELESLLHAEDTGGEAATLDAAPPTIDPLAVRPVASDDDRFFASFEGDHFTRDPERQRRQIAADLALIEQFRAGLDAQRKAGAGKLAGKHTIADFAGMAPFLDGHVYVHPVTSKQRHELTVLGDLHGCYTCLKAALLQADFFTKLAAYRADPLSAPNPKVVLLGDYIDRGLYSYHGVLRSVMELFLAAPDHVYVLRGNHEYYVELNGRVYGAVRPSEAMNTLIDVLPGSYFAAYLQLFEALPSMLFFDRLLFVHAGIPRDKTLGARYRDLSSLNDWDLRFEMLWSDPSSAEHIPDHLQEENARFPFGRRQLDRFMARLGCTALFRGHEKVEEGFRDVYPGHPIKLINLFSAGGATNADLPEGSSYRGVTPMAATVHVEGGTARVVPWAIDWARFNDPARNRFLATRPEIEHKG
jgi:Calcineurin-like phosphoesterase